MDLPIRLRFFGKLTLYQELKKLDCDGKLEWSNERKILSWAADSERHKDWHTPLDLKMALDHGDIVGIIAGDIEDKDTYIRNRFGNLVKRGYATWSDDVKKGIFFTPDGFLMGEIINEIEVNPSARGRYEFFYYLSWVIFFAGAFLVIANALGVLRDWIFGFISYIIFC